MAETKKILLLLPADLLDETGEAAKALCMSRLAFIRQALMKYLGDFTRRQGASAEMEKRRVDWKR